MSDHPTLRQSQPGEVAFLGLVALAAVIGSVNLVAGAIDGVISGTGPAWPRTQRIPHVLFCLYRYPTIPALDYGGSSRYVPGSSALFYWILVGVVLAAVISLMIGVLRLHHRLQGGKTRHNGVRKEAWATRAIVRTHLSEHAAAHRDRLRVRAKSTSRLGQARHLPVYKAGEDSALVVGPSRSGKTAGVVIPMVLDANGPVVTTMTRNDTLTATLAARKRRGDVVVFDPQDLAGGVAPQIHWSLSSGCGDPLTARMRATALVRSTTRGVEHADFWQQRSMQVWETLLHAAALSGADIGELRRWAESPERARTALAELAAHKAAAPGWADSLGAIITSDPRHRDSIWSGVAAAAAPLALPSVAALCDNKGDDVFDIDKFLGGSNTLYLLGTAGGATSVRPIITALIDAIAERGRILASRSPTGRLSHILSLILDEITQLCPLSLLPQLLADGGGSGIPVVAIIQAISQLETWWSAPERSEIWGNASAKIVLGGSGAVEELEAVSRLIGEWTTTEQGSSMSTAGGHTSQFHQVQRRIAPVDLLRELPVGRGVLLYRNVPPVMLDLTAYHKRPDGYELKRAEAAVRKAIGERYAH